MRLLPLRSMDQGIALAAFRQVTWPLVYFDPGSPAGTSGGEAGTAKLFGGMVFVRQ